MTPEARAERLVTDPAALDEIVHGDTFKLESRIAAAIRDAVAEEREKCLAITKDEINRLRWRLNHQTEDDIRNCLTGKHGPDCGAPR